MRVHQVNNTGLGLQVMCKELPDQAQDHCDMAQRVQQMQPWLLHGASWCAATAKKTTLNIFDCVLPESTGSGKPVVAKWAGVVVKAAAMFATQSAAHGQLCKHLQLRVSYWKQTG